MKTLAIYSLFVLVVLCAQSGVADTATLTVLYNFGVTNGQYGSLDGSVPVQPPIIGSDGNLYGTTFDGGTNNDGTVYKLTPQGTLTTLYSFQGYDGFGPRGLLIETNGLFYGTTQLGGSYITVTSFCCGTVFTITPDGNLTTVYSFNSTDGSTVDSGLVPIGDGSYYGTTYAGGTVTTPYTATNVIDSYNDHVQNPPGTVYKFTPPGTVVTLHSFSGPDGANPGKEAVIGTDGNIYGTTLFGGAYNAGTIYTISSAGTFTPLYSFTGGDDGAHPKTRLIQGPDGNFYGTTLDGGGKAGQKTCSSQGCGTIFKITSQGTLTTLHDFDGDPEPAHPGSLALGPDGNLYGTSNTGGTNHEGTVFMMTPEGIVTTLYQFEGPDGANPVGGLTLAGDGSFYGTTSVGGTHSQGTVFRIVINTNANSDCKFTLSPAGVTLPSKGGSKSLSVKVVGTDCSWSAVTTDTFITITGPASGAGNGKVSFTVPGNTNATALSGTITIVGETFIVNQAKGGCTYSLSPKTGKCTAAGGIFTVKVKPSLTDCEWSVTSTDSFITFPGINSGTGPGTVNYTVLPNTNPASRTGVLMIAGAPFTITQAAAKQ